MDAPGVRVRAEHVYCIAVASRGPVDAAAPHVQWATSAGHARMVDRGRVYVDILGHDEEDRVPETYGGAFTRVRLAIGSSAWWAGSARGQTKELGVARPSAPRGGFHERTTSGNRAHG